MINRAIIDETFDSSATPGYHLSVQYGEHHCSLAILDTSTMKYIAFKNFWFSAPVPLKDQASHIRSLLQSEDYLATPYKTVFFMYLTPKSVLVPVSLFQKEKPRVYFNFSSLLLPTDKLIFRKIQAIDAYSVFAVPEDFYNQVSMLVQNVQFFHQTCPQIADAISESGDLAGGHRVLAGIHPGFVDLIVIRAEQLLLMNSFAIRNSDDLVFFILYMYEQFGLSQEESPLILSGFIEMYPGATSLLEQYLKKITLRGFPGNYNYCDSFSAITQHHFSPLINLARCE